MKSPKSPHLSKSPKKSKTRKAKNKYFFGSPDSPYASSTIPEQLTKKLDKEWTKAQEQWIKMHHYDIYLKMYSSYYDQILNYGMRNHFITPFIHFMTRKIIESLYIFKPYSKPICMFRGVSEEYQNYINSFDFDQEIEFKGFNSLTLNHAIARDFGGKTLMKICFPKNSRLVYIAPYSKFPVEEEVLTLPNIVLRYVGDDYFVNEDGKEGKLNVFEVRGYNPIQKISLKGKFFDQCMLYFIYFFMSYLPEEDYQTLKQQFGRIYLQCLKNQKHFETFIQSIIPTKKIKEVKINEDLLMYIDNLIQANQNGQIHLNSNQEDEYTDVKIAILYDDEIEVSGKALLLQEIFE